MPRWRVADGVVFLSSALTGPDIFQSRPCAVCAGCVACRLGAAGRLLSIRGVDPVARLRPQVPDGAMSHAKRRSAHAIATLTTVRVAPMPVPARTGCKGAYRNVER